MAQAAAVSINDTAFQHRNLVGLALPSHWLRKEVTKELNSSSPQFRNHKGCHLLALRHTRLLEKGCKIPTSELKGWIHTSIITGQREISKLNHAKPSKTPNQTRIPCHSSHKEMNQLDLRIQDFFKHLYRAKIFKACAFYKDHFRVTALFSAYCIYKYKSVNLVHHRISRYYTFQLKDNVRIKLQSVSVWNNYIFLNLKWLL